jgi:hypothetical protein
MTTLWSGLRRKTEQISILHGLSKYSNPLRLPASTTDFRLIQVFSRPSCTDHDALCLLCYTRPPLTVFSTRRIGLSLVAIHTTSDLLQEAMIRIAQHPELFQVLRNEIVEVLGRDGLKKTALYNLKTMDSVLKESQRLKTNSLRKATLCFLNFRM